MKKAAIWGALMLFWALAGAGAMAESFFQWQQHELTVLKAQYNADGNISVLLESRTAISMETLREEKEHFVLLDDAGTEYAPAGLMFPAESIKSSGSAVSGFWLTFESSAEIDLCALRVTDGKKQIAIISLSEGSQAEQTMEEQPEDAVNEFSDAAPEQEAEATAKLGVFATVPPAAETENTAKLGVFATVPPSQEAKATAKPGVFATVPPAESENP